MKGWWHFPEGLWGLADEQGRAEGIQDSHAGCRPTLGLQVIEAYKYLGPWLTVNTCRCGETGPALYIPTWPTLPWVSRPLLSKAYLGDGVSLQKGLPLCEACQK